MHEKGANHTVECARVTENHNAWHNHERFQVVEETPCRFAIVGMVVGMEPQQVMVKPEMPWKAFITCSGSDNFSFLHESFYYPDVAVDFKIFDGRMLYCMLVKTNWKCQV